MTPLDIRDIKGPILIQEGSTILVFVGLILVLFIGFFIFYKMKMKKKKPSRPIPPHEIALAALERLKGKGITGTGGAGVFYAEISRIIRDYLDLRFVFGPKTLGMTTEEWLEKMRESKTIPDETQSLLNALMDRCDLVKFARQKPPATEMDLSVELAQLIISQTKETLLP
jgi:hypothetical protein